MSLMLPQTVYWKRRARTRGHGQTDTDRRTRKDGHLWKRRTLMEKTDTYGKDGHLWKRRTLMEKTDTYGKDGHLWKRRALMEKTDTYGKDGHLWKRRTLMEKTDTYGKDGHLWKRRALTEKMGTKDGYVCIYFELNAKCKRNNNNTNQRYGFPELPDASVGLY